MTLYLKNLHPRSRISRLYFERRVRKILRRLKKPHAILGITFVTDSEIKRLNRIYRGKNRPTDVLSFGGEGVRRRRTGEGALRHLLGDVVISIDTARCQAKEKGWLVRSEILFLIIHGILHLLGYDHVKQRDWMKMRRKEKDLWNLCSF